jgi:hypothetical protein
LVHGRCIITRADQLPKRLEIRPVLEAESVGLALPRPEEGNQRIKLAWFFRPVPTSQ